MSYLLLVFLLLTGCSGVYIPPCEVKGQQVATPCLGYSNGQLGGPRKSDMLVHQKPFWPAVLYTDEQDNNRAMKVNP